MAKLSAEKVVLPQERRSTQKKKSHAKCSTRRVVLQGENVRLGSELIDRARSGKPRSWKRRRKDSGEVAKMVYRGTDDKTYENMIHCGTVLVFRENLRTHQERLHRAFFCKKRTCPLCAWRKSQKLGAQMMETMNYLKTHQPGIRFLHLVLSMRNCTGQELGNQIRKMNRAWTRMMSWKRLSSSVSGYYKALEITYNKTEQTYHPHFHILLTVPAEYFHIDQGQYIPQVEWVQLWRKALKLDYDPTAHIQAVKGESSETPETDDNDNSIQMEKAILEVTKYVTKFSDLMAMTNESPEEFKEVILTLDRQTVNIRFLSFGGMIRETRKKLNQEDVETSDFTDPENQGEEGDEFIEKTYEWDPVNEKYILVDQKLVVQTPEKGSG